MTKMVIIKSLGQEITQAQEKEATKELKDIFAAIAAAQSK